MLLHRNLRRIGRLCKWAAPRTLVLSGIALLPLTSFNLLAAPAQKGPVNLAPTQAEADKVTREWNARYAASIPADRKPPANYKPDKPRKMLHGLSVLTDGRKVTLAPTSSLLSFGAKSKIKKLSEFDPGKSLTPFSDFVRDYPNEFILYPVTMSEDGKLPVVDPRSVPSNPYKITVAWFAAQKLPVGVLRPEQANANTPRWPKPSS